MTKKNQAYSFVEYVSEDNKESLIVFNSRENEVPEFIISPKSGKELEFISVKEVKNKHFKPEKGTFIFRDFKEEELDKVSSEEAERIFAAIKEDTTISFGKEYSKNHWKQKVREFIKNDSIPKLVKL